MCLLKTGVLEAVVILNDGSIRRTKMLGNFGHAPGHNMERPHAIDRQKIIKVPGKVAEGLSKVERTIRITIGTGMQSRKKKGH
jgi:hypothetical protein